MQETNNHPKNLSIKDFSYTLPSEKIAKYPLPKRDNSKLLVFENDNIAESNYYSIDAFIPNNSLLVFNNTKVVEARLIFTKATGGEIEIFCLEPHQQYADITIAMLQKTKILYKCLIGGAKKWKEPYLTKEIGDNVVLQAKQIEQLIDCYLIELSWNNEDLTFAEILHIAGLIPLPPYLNRIAEEADKNTYQTIYAKTDGSVAAPTAGLHFTEAIFNNLTKKNIIQSFVTLHVGAGTFKPVKSATMETHEMHREYIDVSIDFIELLVQQILQKNNVVAVGTTALRTIETLYWMGVKTGVFLTQKDGSNVTLEEITIQQWDAYELPQEIPSSTALQQVISWMKMNNTDRLLSKTQIIIAPPYTLKIANGLVTNFHQPESTLLLLVASVVGDKWKAIYQHALDNNYRFLSYGDGCLLWKK